MGLRLQLVGPNGRMPRNSQQMSPPDRIARKVSGAEYGCASPGSNTLQRCWSQRPHTVVILLEVVLAQIGSVLSSLISVATPTRPIDSPGMSRHQGRQHSAESHPADAITL
jgi:hypothetical protein